MKCARESKPNGWRWDKIFDMLYYNSYYEFLSTKDYFSLSIFHNVSKIELQSSLNRTNRQVFRLIIFLFSLLFLPLASECFRQTGWVENIFLLKRHKKEQNLCDISFSFSWYGQFLYPNNIQKNNGMEPKTFQRLIQNKSCSTHFD